MTDSIHLRNTTTDTLVSNGDSATLASSSPQASAFYKSPGSQSLPAGNVIPLDHLNRTLVLTFDGTGDMFDLDNSNIIQFFSMLKKDDRSKQMVYYQAGIGTYTTPEIATPMMAQVSKTLDMMIAWNLDAHVMVPGGYEFLMQNYTAGDRICIFGFSRGAYTARALAGMLHKVGLLPASNHQQVPFAYKMYSQADETGWKQSNAFKKTFSIDVDIEFVGVWDTVNSVGLIPRQLPFTTSNTIVRTFRHAVSLDERRAKFKANLWNRPNAAEETLGIHTATNTHAPSTKPPVHKKPSQHDMERQYSGLSARLTDVDEVWFSGCHCDIGGGSVDNGTRHSLARIPLRWMIRECFKANTGIMFEVDGLRSVGLDPASLYPLVLPRPPALPVGSAHLQDIPTATAQQLQETQLPNYADSDSHTGIALTEEEEDLHDALSPVYDQLLLAWFWWILELLPVKHKYQRSDNAWTQTYWPNMAHGRLIPRQKKQGFRVHRSVKTRLEATHSNGTKYVPRPPFDVEPTWVD